MSYKYKESIKGAVNEVYSASFTDELNRKYELDEVYRKAQAFDDIEERFNSYKKGVKEDYEKDMTGTNLHLLLIGAAVKNHFDNFYVESGKDN